MPVKVRCPNCEKVLNAPDAARGKAVRCPECETKVPVPAEKAATSKPSAKRGDDDDRPAAKKAPAKRKPAKSEEDDDFLTDLNLDSAEDTSARICPKCGTNLREDDDECPSCGYDMSTGGVGRKAAKSRMKGPDPSLFFSRYFGDCWNFAKENGSFTLRTIMYSMIFLTLWLFILWCELACYNLPPKLFCAFLLFVVSMAIPGWLWFLSTEIIKLSIEKKEKLGRTNFDIFLNMALGLKFFVWQFVYYLPVAIVLGGPIILVTFLAGQPLVGLAVNELLRLLVFASFPVVMAHMSMPVQGKAWLFPLMVKPYFRTFGGCLFWCLILFLTNLIPLGILGATGVVYGQAIVEHVGVTEIKNARAALKAYAEADPKNYKAPEPAPIDTVEYPSLTKLIVPIILLYTAVIFSMMTAVFNMRGLGQFAFYFKKRLDLTTREKEIVYKPKPKPGDVDYVPGKGRGLGKKVANPLGMGLAVMGVLTLLNTASGAAFGLMSEEIGLPMGLAIGFALGLVFSIGPASLWVMFEKAGEPGWAAIIPLYNMIVLAKVGGQSPILAIVGFFFSPVILLLLAKAAAAFGKGQMFQIGAALLPPIFLPIIAFSNDEYIGPEE